MSNTPALTRKDMREPDRFQNVAGQAAAWMAARKKLIAVVGGAAALLVIAAGVVASVQGQRAQASGQAVSALLELAAAPVVDAPPADPSEKTFRTEEAKQKALVAEADKVLASHGVGRTTLLAVLTRANALFSLQQWDPAAAAYEQYLQEAGKDDSLRFAALENLGMVAEAKGDLPGAAKAFERMAQETPAYADRADLDRARVLAAAGKVDDARQLLVKFAESHKDSALLSQASMQLGRLGAK